MTELKSILDDAAREGLIPAEVSGRLLPFLVARGVAVIDNAPAGSFEPAVGSDTETPRFVRGFHDVLITIGVVVALSGLWGLASIFAVLPAIIILSEVLVQRQRLALPAVSLTVALLCWIVSFMTFWLPGRFDIWQDGDGAIRFVAAFPIILGLYYLRYRVPLALALCIMSALAFLLTLFFRALQWVGDDPLFVANNPGLISAIFIVCAAGLFATALGFDLSDTTRRTTRSDVAFWLHMGAAPALLYSIVSLFSLRDNIFDLLQNMSIKTPVVVATVAALMLIGLIIDRRAFVTSGLLSLGFAIYGIFRQGSATMNTYLFTTLLIVGMIVLIIGTGWMPLRRLVIGLLPKALSARLPPA
jgi:hypothetical protein